MWFLGDNFLAAKYTQYFKNAFNHDEKVGYIRAHYDVTAFGQVNVDALNSNILSHLRNALIQGINNQILLPRAIVVVLESDLLESLNHYESGVSHACGRLLEWLANKFHRIITAYKEQLPSKARKFKYPTIIWIALPFHNKLGSPQNEFRHKFNVCLESVVSLFREMTMLKLGEPWTNNDDDYVLHQHFTSKGHAAYWQAIDKAVENWDKEQMRVNKPKIPPKWVQNKNQKLKDKFKFNPNKTRFALPPPTKKM